jgi:glycosyltransferase involved in cell wall biosynthesis
MKLVAFALVPAFRIGGGEKWQYECLRELYEKCEEVIYLTVTLDILQKTKLKDVRFQTYDFKTSSWGEELSWDEVSSKIVGSSHAWIFQYQASDISIEIILNLGVNCKVFLTNLGCEPAPFFEYYHQSTRELFLEISEFSASRTSRYVQNVKSVLCGYEPMLERSVNSKNSRNGFVMVGRILPHKRPDFLVDNWEKTDPPLHLIGSCPDGKYIKEIKNKIGEKPINIHSDISNEVRDYIISTSTGLIAPSSVEPEQSELLGLVIFEAIQNGTLPIVSSIPAYEEIMGSLGLDKLVFRWNSGSSLRELCDRLTQMPDTKYISLVNQAREKAKKQYQWANIVPALTINENIGC